MEKTHPRDGSHNLRMPRESNSGRPGCRWQNRKNRETAETAETANRAALEVQGKSTKTSRCPTMEEVRRQQMWGLREKDNVKKEIIAMEDHDDLMLSSEISSENCEVTNADYETILVLLEKLGMECKDSGSLLKIQDTVHSYKKLIHLKSSHCEVLNRKIKKMEKMISALQKELSETEQEKLEQEKEVCNLRFALKHEEEKRRNAVWLCEKIKEQLIEKEEDYNKEVEMKQQLDMCVRTLDMELKTVRNNLTKALEERNDTQRKLSQEQNARILQDEILANHLCKEKEIEMETEKMSAELQELWDLQTKTGQHAVQMQERVKKYEYLSVHEAYSQYRLRIISSMVTCTFM
ncbi:ankyrin repeat domain-containing protein 26-like [Castor canadensis]|uniref:Ankyrin repeat domain-containing protein 26-like n=1 Tax=Castor canadensis TaxID=51338 RepID=A0AC58L2Y6_CASCN